MLRGRGVFPDCGHKGSLSQRGESQAHGTKRLLGSSTCCGIIPLVCITWLPSSLSRGTELQAHGGKEAPYCIRVLPARSTQHLSISWEWMEVSGQRRSRAPALAALIFQGCSRPWQYCQAHLVLLEVFLLDPGQNELPGLSSVARLGVRNAEPRSPSFWWWWWWGRISNKSSSLCKSTLASSLLPMPPCSNFLLNDPHS